MKRVVMNCRKTFVVYHTCNWYSQWEGGQKKQLKTQRLKTF